jgi:hypothetical protein
MFYNSYMNPIAVHPSLLHPVMMPAPFLCSSSKSHGACMMGGSPGTTRSMDTRMVRDRAENTRQAFGIGTSPRWEAMMWISDGIGTSPHRKDAMFLLDGIGTSPDHQKERHT